MQSVIGLQSGTGSHGVCWIGVWLHARLRVYYLPCM
jgi:hypothetical protein